MIVLALAACRASPRDAEAPEPSAEPLSPALARFFARSFVYPANLSAADAQDVERALLDLDRGRHERAAPVLDALLERSPDFGEAWFWRGQCHARSGAILKEMECYRRCLAALPMHPEARSALADCYLELRRYDDALAEYRRLLRLQPEHEVALFNAALLLMDRGLEEVNKDDLEEALDLWNRTLAVDGDETRRQQAALERARVLSDLAIAFQEEPTRREALERWRELQESYPDAAHLREEAERQSQRLQTPFPNAVPLGNDAPGTG